MFKFVFISNEFAINPDSIAYMIENFDPESNQYSTHIYYKNDSTSVDINMRLAKVVKILNGEPE